MPLDPRSILRTYFETGDVPTKARFENLIGSSLWMEVGFGGSIEQPYLELDSLSGGFLHDSLGQIVLLGEGERVSGVLAPGDACLLRARDAPPGIFVVVEGRVVGLPRRRRVDRRDGSQSRCGRLWHAALNVLDDDVDPVEVVPILEVIVARAEPEDGDHELLTVGLGDLDRTDLVAPARVGVDGDVGDRSLRRAAGGGEKQEDPSRGRQNDSTSKLGQRQGTLSLP